MPSEHESLGQRRVHAAVHDAELLADLVGDRHLSAHDAIAVIEELYS